MTSSAGRRTETSLRPSSSAHWSYAEPRRPRDEHVASAKKRKRVTIALRRFGALIGRGPGEILWEDERLRLVGHDLDAAALECALTEQKPDRTILDNATVTEPSLLPKSLGAHPDRARRDGAPSDSRLRRETACRRRNLCCARCARQGADALAAPDAGRSGARPSTRAPSPHRPGWLRARKWITPVTDAGITEGCSIRSPRVGNAPKVIAFMQADWMTVTMSARGRSCVLGAAAELQGRGSGGRRCPSFRSAGR